MADCAICVAIRSRPLLKSEVQSSDALSFEGNSTVSLQKKNYMFDYVFRPGVTNEAVYNAVVAEKIKPIFEGYNVTILAYGPTGSGKTYTMGTDYNPKTASNSDIGIIPRGISEIFRVIESQKHTINFVVKVSFLELYREEIFDLLQNAKTACNLREDGEGVRVVNLTEVPVNSVEDAFVTLEKGSTLRHTSATAKNLKSSRSHAIFSVYIEQTDMTTFNFKRSKFQMVDLAGSERIHSSKTAGLQVKEGININLGLLSLGKVITHLIEEKQHIPYRDSKLTRLLQDSLGGNSHTVMIACVNPSATNTEETLSTLRYASNTRRIKNRPVVNVDPPALQIEKLKKQVESLQAALYDSQSGSGSTTDVPSESGEAKVSKVEVLRVELHDSISRISSLVEKITKMEDKWTTAYESLQSLYSKIKLIVSSMTTAVAEDPSWEAGKDLLGKLEEILAHCLELTISANMTNLEYDETVQPGDSQSTLEEIGESEILNPELQIIELQELSEKHKGQFENIENIDRTLSIKYDQVKNMQIFNQNYGTGVNEDYINTLMNQIQGLVLEKNKLEELMKVAEERVRTENQEKIGNYEKQISNLKLELRKKKVVLQTKEENHVKLQQLNFEITNLKKTKVQLVKQMRQDAKEHLQKQQVKEKEVAKLVRESRRKDNELGKMKIKFEREVHVLKQKIERFTSAKIKAGKKPWKTVVKGRPSTPQENVEEWISEELKKKIDFEIAKRQSEALEKESQSLKEQIKSMVELSNSVDEGTSSESDVNSQKALVDAIDKRIAEIKESAKDETGRSCPILESLNSMGQAKSATETLFKKCVSEAVEAEMLQVNYQEQLKKEKSNMELHQEKIKCLEHDIEKLNQKIKSVNLEHEKEKASLKYQYDAKIMDLLTEYQEAIKSAVGSETDPALIEKIEYQQKEIQRLQHIHQDYDHKCKEVMMLQQQLFQAKKGKKATWLGHLTQQTVIQTSSSTSTSPDESTSMLEAFLSSADESFGNDEKDPDWRLTPAYRRRKEAAKAKREARKRRLAEEPLQFTDTSDASSPKKKNLICKCRTDCKSMRCICKKNAVKCNALCGCIRDKCDNVEKVMEATHISDDIIEIEIKKKPFAD